MQGYSSNLISCNPVAEAPNAQKEKDAQGSLSFPVYVYYSQNSQTHFSVAGGWRQFKFEPPSPVSTVQLLFMVGLNELQSCCLVVRRCSFVVSSRMSLTAKPRSQKTTKNKQGFYVSVNVDAF